MVAVNGANSSALEPSSFAAADGKLFFSAIDNLFVLDGATDGTTKVPVSNTFRNGLMPYDTTVISGTVYLSGYNPDGTSTLWSTNGTSIGTIRLSTARFARTIAPLGNLVAFSGLDLYTYNPASKVTMRVSGAGVSAINGFDIVDGGLASIGNRLVFVGLNAAERNALWVSDGTTAGTVQLAVPGLAPHSGFSTTGRDTVVGFTSFGNRAAFTSLDTAGVFGIWITDGTVAGTVELAGVHANHSGSSMAVLADGRLAFTALDALGVSRVYLTDGSGIVPVSVPGVPDAALRPNTLMAFGNRIVFDGFSATGTAGLYVSDGTAAGGSLLASGLTALPFGSAVLPASSRFTSPDPLFNVAYYLAHNPDVAAAGIDPYSHYMSIGWKEGRDPSANFSTTYYLSHNPDVAAAGVNPLSHFETFGWTEGRDPSASFSTRDYLAAYPDVRAAGIDPLLHCVAIGQFEFGRMSFQVSGAAGVDAAYYNATYPGAGADASADFLSTGWLAGRNPDAWFDTSYYLAHNPDVAAAHIDPLLHYEAIGWIELRNPSAQFSTSYYLSAYPDVRASGQNPLLQFLSTGRAEGRTAFAV